MRFPGKAALITAAGSGIGRASAEIIGREGGTVVAVDLDKDALESLVGTVRAAGGTAHAVPADGLEADQVGDVVGPTVDAHGRINILVNAIGNTKHIGRTAAPVKMLPLGGRPKLLH